MTFIPLTVTRRQSVDDTSVQIVSCQGDLVIQEAERLKEAVKAVLDEGEVNVLIDLSELRSVDSSGVGWLVSSYTSVKNARGSLRLLCPSEKIKSLLERLHLDTVFRCYDNERDAVNSFGVGF